MAVERLVVVAGPSGSGKSTAATGTGAPVLGLDAFYRDSRSPGLPRWRGDVDWEDPASFDLDAAVRALREILATGAATVAVHDVVSSIDSPPRVLRFDAPCLVVEGVLAVAVLQAAAPLPVPASAYVLRRARLANAVARLRRDVTARGRSPWRAALRSWRVFRQEPSLVAAAIAAGAQPVSRHQLRGALAAELEACSARP